MVIPMYPSPGPETIVDIPGYYKGYFCAFPPGYGTPYDYVPAVDWNVISWDKMSSLGGHGCCDECAVTLLELEYTKDKTNELNVLTYVGLAIVVAFIGVFLISRR